MVLGIICKAPRSTNLCMRYTNKLLLLLLLLLLLSLSLSLSLSLLILFKRSTQETTLKNKSHGALCQNAHFNDAFKMLKN